METIKKNNPYRYVAGALFVICGIYGSLMDYWIISDLGCGWDYEITYQPYRAFILVGFVACIFLAIGLFVRNRSLMIAGCSVFIVIHLVLILYVVITHDQRMGQILDGSYNTLNHAILLVAALLLLLCILQKPNRPIELGIASGALVIIAFFACGLIAIHMYNEAYNNYSYSFSSYSFGDDYFRFKYFFSSFLRGGACLFTGLALSNKFETEIKKKEINSSLAPEEMIQKMEQLTHLLEKSIITKEEFEEKKKQVLGVNAPNPNEQEVKEESSY